MEANAPIKQYTFTELLNLYRNDGQLSIQTFRKWIDAAGIIRTYTDNEGKIHRKKIYTPKEVEQIFKHLGTPAITINTVK
jgi:hypothetical protein